MSAALQLVTDVDTCQQAGPDLREWIALDDAAKLLGLHRDHLARECREKLERVGRAKKAKPEGGGAAKWFIARRHDLRLAPGAVGAAYQQPELSAYTRRQVDDAYARVACVESYRDARDYWPGNQKDWLSRLVKQLAEQHPSIKISKRSLRRWYKDYQRPEDLAKLISNAGGNRRGQADPSCWQAFKDLYLSESRLTLVSCWRQVDAYAQAHGLAWVTEAACRNQLDDRISPEEQAKYRDPKAYRNGFQPYIEQDPEKYEAGERWDGDHCVLDLLCWHGEGNRQKLIRPWLTAWMDWRTRKIVGWHLSDGPNSYTILSAFRAAMLDESNHGGPGIVWIDNGKDYDSYTLHGETKAERKKKRIKDQFLNKERNRLAKIEGGMRVDEERIRFGVFKLLDIDPHFSIPYNPTGKARLERWFGTMHDQFDKFFSTYCGPTVVDRPEDLAKRCKEQPHTVPSFDTVLKNLQAFIDEYNNTVSMARRGAEGLSPAQAMQTLPHTIRTIHDPNVLNQCMGMWSKPVSVTRNGIRICPGNVVYTYGRHDLSLRALIGTGQKVHVRYDPADMREAEVYDVNGRHLCTASSNERVGNDPVKHDDMKRVMNERRRNTKQREKLHRTALDDIMPLSHAYAIDQAKKRRDKTPPLRIDPAAIKTEPREVKLDPKPVKFDLAEHLRKNGGLSDITELLKKKQAEAAEQEDSALDTLDLREHQPDEDDAIDIFGELSWPLPIAEEEEVEFDFFEERQAEGGAA